MIRVSRRALIAVVAVLAVILGFLALDRTGILTAALEPTRVADAKAMDAQRTAAERGIQRAYAGAVLQVEQSKSLKLAITDQQASDIRTKALGDLRTLRHNALVSVAGLLGSGTGDAERYATTTEQKLDAAPVPDRTSTEPVLLAPRLYAIVQRMDEISPQLTDKALRNLTVPPTPRPTSSP